MIQNTNYGASKTYVNTKVDKLTTSGLKVYAHDGATQGEIDVSNTYTPSTLAFRDANGRMQAADPASGATDKTLTTANWISQTGNSAPNNLIHRSGNEDKSGSFSLINGAFQIKDTADIVRATGYLSGTDGLIIRRYNTTDRNYMIEIRLTADNTKTQLVMLSYKNVNNTITLADYHVIYSFTF